MSSSSSPAPDSPLPFELRALIRHVFASDCSPVVSSPTHVPHAEPSKNPVIRSVDGHGQLLWVGSSDGRVKGFDIKASTSLHRVNHNRVVLELAENSNSPRVQGGPSANQLDLIETSCFQDYKVFPLTDHSKPKPVEKLILVPLVGLAIILSEGTLTFHSITDLQPCPTSSYPCIRAVSAVTLDENSYHLNASSNQPDVLMCVIKKKNIFLYLLSMAGVKQVHEVAFASAAFQSLLRGSTLLLSDIEQYYLISLDRKPPQAVPLLPISQTSSKLPDIASTTSSPAPRLRPSMAAIPNTQEFLLASHTGSTCLGIFVSSSGEPSRGTLQWPSNPRSVAVDVNYVLALLFNGTIEVHSLETQELLHVITLPISLDARSLASAKFGISLPGESYASYLNTVPFSLDTPQLSLPSSSKIKTPSSPPAPTESRILLVGRDSLYALATRTFLAEVETLIWCNRWDDALAMAGRLSETHQQTRSTTLTSSKSENFGLINQLNFVHQKISLHYLVEVRFDEAVNLWFKGCGDPRILLQLFPLLTASMLSKTDKLHIFDGLIDLIREIKSAEELITMHSVRNCSLIHHTEPQESSNPLEADLQERLRESARQALLKYLHRWRRDRLIKGGASDSNRRLDSIVDTALVELLSDRRQIDPEAYAALKQMLARPNSCIFPEIENVLLENNCFCILCKIYLKRDEIPKAFDIWAKLHDKRISDADFHEEFDQMASVLLNYNDPQFVFKYAIWMAPFDHLLAVKVLAESKVSHLLDPPTTFRSLSEFSPKAAELYLEQIILEQSKRGLENSKSESMRRNEESANHLFDLRTELVSVYLNKLKKLMSSSDGKPSLVLNFFRHLIQVFMDLPTNDSNLRISFVEFFLRVSTTDMPDQGSSQIADAIQTRAKLMVCLDQSSLSDPDYDALKVRTIIDDMGASTEVLALERAMVYSKIGLHRPALSLLAITLEDMRSAETYCLQSGRLLSFTQANELMAMGRIRNFEARGFSTALNKGPSSTELLTTCFDLLIGSPYPKVQIDMLLCRHSSRIPLEASLVRLPPQWALDPILAPYLTRGLRRSFHQTHESTIVKSIALGHKMTLAISWRDHQDYLKSFPDHR